jgi:hypothetical protein
MRFSDQYNNLLAGVFSSEREREQQIRQEQQRAFLLSQLAKDPSSSLHVNVAPLQGIQGIQGMHGSRLAGLSGHHLASNPGLFLELERANAHQQLLYDARQLQAQQQLLMAAAAQPQHLSQSFASQRSNYHYCPPVLSASTASPSMMLDEAPSIKNNKRSNKSSSSSSNGGANKPPKKKQRVGGSAPPLSVPCRCRGMPDDHNPKVSPCCSYSIEYIIYFCIYI